MQRETFQRGEAETSEAGGVRPTKDMMAWRSLLLRFGGSGHRQESIGMEIRSGCYWDNLVELMFSVSRFQRVVEVRG